MKKFTMEARTVQPKDFKVWAIVGEEHEEAEIEVQAFTVKEATEIVRKAFEEDNTKLRIRVCVEAEKFEKAKTDWLERLEANRIKNNARNIGKVKELAEIIKDKATLHKVLEIVGLTEFAEYLD